MHSDSKILTQEEPSLSHLDSKLNQFSVDFREKNAHSEIQSFFDRIEPERDQWKKRNSYYYQKITEYMRFLVPEDYKVLEIGSGDGCLLNDLKPLRGVGIDASPAFLNTSSQKFPELEFQHGFAETFKMEEKFDYVIMSNLVGYLFDVEKSFKNLHQVCTPQTRIVVHYYNYLWEPLGSIADKIGLRMKQAYQNWLSLSDLENLLHLSGFETVKKMRKVLFPFYIPIISTLINKYIANLPFINRFCFSEFIVARPIQKPIHHTPKVSVVVACKDEKGNIQELVERTPRFEGGVEMVFVDGHSTDGTMEEIERMKTLYPEKNIRAFTQGETKGKGAAVRVGFDQSKGEVLIILDADISVAPEDITKFYNQLIEGRGELINGSRLVYPMEKHAMRFLNIYGNKFFSKAFTYLLDQELKDTLCGTKVLFKKDYEKIAKNRAFFGEFDPFGDFDLLFGAAKLNLKILELPVRYYERRYGDIKIRRFQHGMLLLGMCGIALKRLKFI